MASFKLPFGLIWSIIYGDNTFCSVFCFSHKKRTKWRGEVVVFWCFFSRDMWAFCNFFPRWEYDNLCAYMYVYMSVILLLAT